MNRRAALAVLAGLTPLLPVPVAALRDSGQALEPLRVIECADFAGAPVALAHGNGRMYLLDPMEQAIWTILEPAGGQATGRPADGRPRTIDIPSSTVRSMFFGCGGALYLVDPMERALYVQEPDESGWRRWRLGYRVFFGAGDRETILFNADRRHDAHLVTAVTCAGDTLQLGARKIHPDPLASVGNSLNYVRLALSPDILAVGQIALGHLQILDRKGVLVAEVSLTGPQIVQMRRMYLSSQGRRTSGRLAVDHDTLVADLVRAARSDRMVLPVYINDLAIHRDLIWVLANNTLQVFDHRAEQVARHAIGGRHRGEVVVIHAFCITAEGRLYGLDAAHYRKIYDFGSVDLLVDRVPGPADGGDTSR